MLFVRYLEESKIFDFLLRDIPELPVITWRGDRMTLNSPNIIISGKTFTHFKRLGTANQYIFKDGLAYFITAFKKKAVDFKHILLS